MAKSAKSTCGNQALGRAAVRYAILKELLANSCQLTKVT
jgi:hypothetical protein